MMLTRFCCDAWSRNCCAVSNSFLSTNRYMILYTIWKYH